MKVQILIQLQEKIQNKMKLQTGIAIIVFNLASTLFIFAQVPETDVFLIEIKTEKYILSFGKPLNITDKKGYDNQPVFSPANNSLLYVSMEDTIQTDIYFYDIVNKKTVKTANTPESEFSPNYISGNKGISIVRVDSDKAQRLYKYTSSPNDAEVLIEGVDSVGYYKWMNDSTLALVVLNNGLELHIYELFSQQFIVAVKNVGRCLLTDPETGHLIFSTGSSGESTLMKLNPETYEAELYCNGYKDSKDYVFTIKGALWTGWEGKLFELDIKKSKEWMELADFTKSVGFFYRLALSSNGNYLAVVSYKDVRP